MPDRTARSRCLAVLTVAVLSPVLLAGCADSDSPSSDAPPPAVDPSMTVEYAPGLSTDVYLPAGQGRVPLVVLVPGGSWTTADPAGLAGLAAALSQDGIVAAPTTIRAAEDGVEYPVPVEDVLCAVATTVEEVGAQGFVAGPVAVLGHSSGAHLAALAVLAVDDYSPDCAAPVVRPDALVGLSGPYDITQLQDVAAALLGTGLADDPGAWESANPVERADLRPEVPVLLLHGEDDDTVSSGFTTQFAGALEDAGHPTTVELVPEADHLEIFRSDVAGDLVGQWLLGLDG